MAPLPFSLLEKLRYLSSLPFPSSLWCFGIVLPLSHLLRDLFSNFLQLFGPFLVSATFALSSRPTSLLCTAFSASNLLRQWASWRHWHASSSAVGSVFNNAFSDSETEPRLADGVPKRAAAREGGQPLQNYIYLCFVHTFRRWSLSLAVLILSIPLMSSTRWICFTSLLLAFLCHSSWPHHTLFTSTGADYDSRFANALGPFVFLVVDASLD